MHRIAALLLLVSACATMRARPALEPCAGHACAKLGAAETRPGIAALYYKRACDGSDGAGCHALANAYRQGRGVVKDLMHARFLYGAACKAGNGSGCAQLGKMAAAGEGGTQDDRLALMSFEKGCARNDAASCALGAAQAAKNGDSVKAKILREKACAQGVGTMCNAG